MASFAQNRRDARPHPAAAPSAVDQYESQDYFLAGWAAAGAAAAGAGAPALKTAERSISSSFTAALLRASISASLRGVSLVACSKASASLKQKVASAFGSGFFWSPPASVPYTRADRLTKIRSARSTYGSLAGAAAALPAGGAFSPPPPPLMV